MRCLCMTAFILGVLAHSTVFAQHPDAGSYFPPVKDNACVDEKAMLKHAQAVLKSSHASTPARLPKGLLEAQFSEFARQTQAALPSNVFQTSFLEVIQTIARGVDGAPAPIHPVLGSVMPTRAPGVPQAAATVSGVGVGRLKVQDIDLSTQAPAYFPLGTTFVVAPGVIATACHVIQPIVEKRDGHWQLSQNSSGKVVVDFGESEDLSAQSFQVKEILGYAAQEGFDVVFLSVARRNLRDDADLPSALTLSSDAVADSQSFVLVGYPDVAHAIDAVSRSDYQDFRSGQHANVPGSITTTNACKGSLDIVLELSKTIVGESGAPLFNPTSHEVLGLHTCCDAASTQAGVPPPSDLECANLRSTYYNQAVSSWSIWHEPNLAAILHAHGVVPPGDGFGGLK